LEAREELAKIGETVTGSKYRATSEEAQGNDRWFKAV
jgi:hypothetical protein